MATLIRIFACIVLLFTARTARATVAAPPDIIYKNGISIITGTWNTKISEITAENPYEGGQHLRFLNYDLGGGWWDGFGLNFDKWGASPPINFKGTKTHLRLAYRGLGMGHILQIRLKDATGALGTLIDVGEPTSTYRIIEIPLASLSTGLNQEAISEIQLNVTGAATGQGTLYIDNLELITKNVTILPPTTAHIRATKLGIGFNLTNWLEAYWLIPFNTYPQNNYFTEPEIATLAAYGFKTIRMPVVFERLAGATAPYTLNTAHPAFVVIDQIIGWADKYNLNLIIDNHHASPDLTDANYAAEIPRITAVWKQLAARYGSLDPNRFFFELYNEPNGISNTNVRAVMQATIDAIRSTGDNHTLIVGGSHWNSGADLSAVGTFSDNNLIYTFHNYDPFLFTHQGFDWNGDGAPDYGPAGVTFPQTATSIATIKNYFTDVKTWSAQNNVPIFLGEFGVGGFADATSRCNWIKMMGEIIDTHQLSAAYWDVRFLNGGFGFFNNSTVQAGNANTCFASALHLEYCNTTIPLIGASEVCIDGINSYSVAPVTGASLYTWTVMNGTIVSGQGTPNIKVKWDKGGVMGSISVNVK
jgi:endoglucanase